MVAKNWGKIQHAILVPVDAVVGFVRSHWELLLAILTGTELVLMVARNWSKIEHAALAGADDVVGVVTRLAGDVGRWFVHMFDLVISTEERGIGNIVSWFEGLPQRILSALGDVGSLLFSSGKKIVQSLLNGIKSMIGDVGSAIGGVVDEVKNFLPFSPAKKGPLSGSGAPDRSGRSIGRLLARGLTASAAGRRPGGGPAGPRSAGRGPPRVGGPAGG